MGLKEEASKTEKLQKLLEQSVIGQPQAINAAFEGLCISLSGFTLNKKPAGVFLFIGSSGVGKTALAEAVALAGGRKLLRYDMAEYQFKH